MTNTELTVCPTRNIPSKSNGNDMIGMMEFAEVVQVIRMKETLRITRIDYAWAMSESLGISQMSWQKGMMVDSGEMFEAAGGRRE